MIYYYYDNKNILPKSMNIEHWGDIMNNSSTNNSAIDVSVQTFPVYLLVLLFLTFLTGIVGNFLLIISHIKDPLKVIKSSSSYFIINISVGDFLSSCGLFLAFSFSNTTIIVEIAGSLIAFPYTASFALYLNLAIQRFCSVAFPLWHRVKITTRVCRYWATGIWLANIVLKGGMIVIESKTEFKIQMDLTVLIMKWFMFSITQFLHIASCVSIRKQNRRLRKRSELNAATERAIIIHLKNERNFVVTIATACFVQGVTILPFLSMAFIAIVNATKNSEKDYETTPSFYYILGVLGIGFNSAINVFIYIWRLPKYRKTFKKLYCDC